MTSHWEYSLSPGGMRVNVEELYKIFLATKCYNSKASYSFEEIVPDNLQFLAEVILVMHKQSDNHQEEVMFWEDGVFHSCYSVSVKQGTPIFNTKLMFNAKEK